MDNIIGGFLIGIVILLVFRSQRKKNKSDKLGTVVKRSKGYLIRRMDGGFGVYVGKSLKKGPFEDFQEAYNYSQNS